MNEDRILDIIDPLVTDLDIGGQELSLSQHLHDFVKICEEYTIPNVDTAIAIMGKVNTTKKGGEILFEKAKEYLAKEYPDFDKLQFSGIEINRITAHSYTYLTKEVIELQDQIAALTIKLNEAKKKAEAEAEAIEAQISLERSKLKSDTKALAFLKDSLSKIRKKVVKSVYWKTKF